MNVQGSSGRGGRGDQPRILVPSRCSLHVNHCPRFPPPKGRTLRLQTDRCSVWPASFSAFPNAQIHNATNGIFYMPSCRKLSAGPARVIAVPTARVLRCNLWSECLSLQFVAGLDWMHRGKSGSGNVHVLRTSSSAGHLPAWTSFVRNRLECLKV